MGAASSAPTQISRAGARFLAPIVPGANVCTPAYLGALSIQMGGKRLGRGRYDPAAKVARLVDAAAAVIGERGLAGATIPRIAARAGVSRGLIHYHFPDREALVHAAARSHCGRWVETVGAAVARHTGSAEVAREVVAAVRALAAQHPTFWAGHAALASGAQYDGVLAEIMAAAHRDAARLIGPLDALLCGFATRPDAREMDPVAWAEVEAAAVVLLRAREGS